MLLAECAGLLVQSGGQGALGQTQGRCARDLLHGIEVYVEARPLLTEGTAGHDFTPARGQVPDFLEEFRRKCATCHVWYCLVLATKWWT